MLTRNWYNSVKSGMCQTVIPQGLKNTKGAVYGSGYSGESNISKCFSFALNATVRSSASGSSICIGSGTTPPTLDDYNLESQISSALTSTTSVMMDEQGNAVRVFTVTNSGSDPIDINEIGWIENCYPQASASGAQYCMLDRTVLPQTVTIPAGGVGQIKYTITLPQIPE